MFDEYGNPVDSSFTGLTYDAQGNALGYASPAAAYTNAGTYTAATAPASTPAWLTQVLGAAPSLANSAASIYASSTAGKNQPKLPALAQIKPSVSGAPAAGMSMTTILVLVVVGILSLVLIVPRLMGRGK